jgi:YD repeat-containing protein
MKTEVSPATPTTKDLACQRATVRLQTGARLLTLTAAGLMGTSACWADYGCVLSNICSYNGSQSKVWQDLNKYLFNLEPQADNHGIPSARYWVPVSTTKRDDGKTSIEYLSHGFDSSGYIGFSYSNKTAWNCLGPQLIDDDSNALLVQVVAYCAEHGNGQQITELRYSGKPIDIGGDKVVIPVTGVMVSGPNSTPFSDEVQAYRKRVWLLTEELRHTCDKVGDPVHIGSGMRSHIAIDIAPAPSSGLGYSRTYRSNSTAVVVGNTLGWHSAYDTAVLYAPGNSDDGYAANHTFVTRPDGQVLTAPFDKDVNDQLITIKDAGDKVLGWRFADQSRRQIEAYDQGGILQAIHTISGQTFTLTYGEQGKAPRQLSSVTDSFGRKLKFDYDGAGRMNRLTDPNGQEVRYTYTGIGAVLGATYNVKTVTYPTVQTEAPAILTYHYEDPGLPNALTGITDEKGWRLATFGYNPYISSGYAMSTTLHAGPGKDVDTYSFNYSATSSSSTNSYFTDPHGNTITYTHENIGGVRRITSQNQPAGSGCNASSSELSYDANANITSRTDFSDRKTCYAYDQLSNDQKNLENVRVEGLLGSATCPADLVGYQVPGDLPLEQPRRKTTTRWHPAWRLPIQQAEPLRITSWVYNGQPDPSNGNKPLFCAPDNAVLPDGQPIVVLCKRIEQATIDASGSKGLQATPQGPSRQWSYSYNRFGQKLTEVDPRAKTSRWEYFDDTSAEHTQGDLRSTTNAAGQTSRYSRYDKAGRVLTMTDANGVVTQYSYTPRGWLKSATVNPPSGGGASEVTGYDHYPTGLLKLATLPDGSTLKYDYDDAHRLTDITDSAGNTVHYTLDEMGNRKGEQLKDQSGTLARSITRIFDDLNRLQNITGAEQ